MEEDEELAIEHGIEFILGFGTPVLKDIYFATVKL